MVAPGTGTPDFSQREVTGTVHTMRTFEFGWTLVTLTNGTVVHGEFEDGELEYSLTYRFFGAWQHHGKYGPQFAVDSFVLAQAQTEAGTIAYLTRGGAGLTRGQAKKLWDAFGADAAKKLREEPAAAAETMGIEPSAAEHYAEKLRDAAKHEAATIELFGLFASRGFPRGAVKSCVRAWGERAPEVVRRDPFKMLVAEIPGVGFKRADALYIDLGGNPRRIRRQMFAAWHWLRTCADGNTWEPLPKVAAAIITAIGNAADYEKAIRLGVRAKWLAEKSLDSGGTPEVHLAERENAANEAAIASHAKRIAKQRARWPKESELDPALSEHQRAKLATILDAPLAILAGTPGTGKTFSAAALIRGLLTRSPRPKIFVCAPTGKAAVRITEAMTKYNLGLQATTIHTLLKVQGYASGKASFAKGEANPLECDLVVVDESSMIDADLMAALLRAIPHNANLLLIGDPFQLPPVGHGAPLRDMIAGGVPCALLEEIQRNAGDIVTACRDIKNGCIFTPSTRIDIDAGLNLRHVQADTPMETATVVIDLLGALATRGYNPVWDVQVLVARNDGDLGRKPLNARLQSFLNAQFETNDKLRNAEFRRDDKVICLKNTTIIGHHLGTMLDPTRISSYRSSGQKQYIANGDMGRVMATEKDAVVIKFFGPDRYVKVNTSKRKKKPEGYGDGDSATSNAVDFDLAYAVTTHKSQGSEWPVVIVVLDESGGRVTCREWIYTAISRAAKLCFVVGKLATAYKMVQRVELTRRRTALQELLRGTNG